MLNAETLLEPKFATYRNFPVGSTVNPAISIPARVENGEPAIAVSAPLAELIANADTSVDTAFATYAKCPEGFTPTAEGDVPAVNGEPGTAVSAPRLGSML